MFPWVCAISAVADEKFEVCLIVRGNSCVMQRGSVSGSLVVLRCDRKWDAWPEALTFTPHLGSQLPVAGRGPDQNSPVNCRLSTLPKTVCDLCFQSFVRAFGSSSGIRWLGIVRYGGYSSYQGKLPQGM